jgi:dephospho-CoA kinase
MIVLGLTGSIGMGKSTTAAMFRQAGAAVYDADAEVAALYAPGGAGVAPVAAVFPGAVLDGGVDRARLSALLLEDPEALARLEGIVHPLVAARRAAMLHAAARDGYAVSVLDIPLLFETGGQALVDAVVVVSAPAAVQRMRVLARPGMSAQKLDMILTRQTPDAQKRAWADFVIDTSLGLDVARDQVETIMRTVTAPGWSPRQRPA